VTNPATGVVRIATSNENGAYIVPQLTPGNYSISVEKQGFGAEKRDNVQLEVNQSITLDFKLGVATAAQTVTVTGATPMLNTTSSTLSDVINHDATVDLPLNGREFTQLTLLTPGVAPVQTSQQAAFVIALGAGGISPSVNGQRGEQNNFTMDGVLNNATFTNTWAIAPPPDAIQEFNVQSHITDAQFAISSGSNINVVTRSGTNDFHGALWEFLRNDALDAQTFPESARLPYRQNQYGVYLGGPVWIPHVINGKNNTWFSLYWEGFRSSQSTTYLASVLTPNMVAGNFSNVLGAQIGTDDHGRPEYANEIYDPLTSVPDPANPGQYIRNPFPNNTIPSDRLNPASLQILQKYYPAPNLNVPDGVLPNLSFNGATTIASDVFGGRLDHQFTENDTLFARFNRSNQHRTSPEALPTYHSTLSNYAQQAVVGYTHLFDPKTILNFHYGYTYVNFAIGDEPAGAAFANSVNFTEAVPLHDGIQLGPQLSIANGYAGVNQTIDPFGPIETMDYHLDLSKVISHHTLGIGGMYYHLRSYDDGWFANSAFTQNATSESAAAGPTGFGPASFMLGTPDTYNPWVGNTGADQTINWYGLYAQDQWQVTNRLVLTAGVRWDYVSPPNFHKIVSALNVLTGQFIVTGAVPPNFPAATGPKGLFNSQWNGWEPRFGLTYQASNKTVFHSAFAILDDHNNTLIQENQGIRVSWPTATSTTLTNLDLGIPSTYINNLPPASTFLSALAPYASYGADQNNKIPYSIQYNVGIQEQLSNSMVFKLDYVGSLSRHQYIVPEANTALYPGPGTISARQPYPQYGGPFSFEWNEAPASYNALQAHLQRSFSSGLFFLASYTWSKSMDWQSDPYTNTEEDFYNLKREWGPSDYNRTQMFVLSGVYALPVGKGKAFLSRANPIAEAVAGNWNIGTIITLDSGAPFYVLAGADVANTGAPNQRADRTGENPYSAPGFSQSYHGWLNKGAFAVPASFTFGNETRNDLVGPTHRNVDFNVSKSFPFFEGAALQFRGEFFNIFNQTNYSNPDNGVQDGTFGQILSAAATGREIQFALKVVF
jgi:Carboxypeptidase regulatory-like domain/TonB dependent receptor